MQQIAITTVPPIWKLVFYMTFTVDHFTDASYDGK